MIKTIKLETAASRVLLAVAGLACLLTTFFFVKWCFANAIAARAPDRQVAETAVALAPNDPQTHYAVAVLNEKTFLAEDLSASLAGFERATALAPNDFRLWVAFGKARERRGDQAGAELALRRASELAPNYAPVQWTLGNILLRGGKVGEAFAEIRRAADASSVYRLSAAATTWQIFGGDLAEVKKHIGDSENLNSALAVFTAKQKRFDEAVEIWNSLAAPPAENIKTERRADGEELFNELIAAKRYRDALRVQTSLSNESETVEITPGKIVNGGFEADVKREKAGVFEWRIGDGAQPQIGFDDREKRGGARSLVIVFDSTDGKDFRQISQTAALASAGKYVFEINYKSNLKTAAAPRWEIVDAANDKILATTAALEEKADWTALKTEFTASEATQAVTIRLAREPCKSIICPTAGKIWFDDFSIYQ